MPPAASTRHVATTQQETAANGGDGATASLSCPKTLQLSFVVHKLCCLFASGTTIRGMLALVMRQQLEETSSTYACCCSSRRALFGMHAWPSQGVFCKQRRPIANPHCSECTAAPGVCTIPGVDRIGPPTQPEHSHPHSPSTATHTARAKNTGWGPTGNVHGQQGPRRRQVCIVNMCQVYAQVQAHQDCPSHALSCPSHSTAHTWWSVVRAHCIASVACYS